MAWLILIFAGIFEVVWAYSMKLSQGFTRLTPSVITVIFMLLSVVLLAYAMRTLPLGTAYTIWTGIGAVGSFLVGIFILGARAVSAGSLSSGFRSLVEISGTGKKRPAADVLPRIPSWLTPVIIRPFVENHSPSDDLFRSKAVRINDGERMPLVCHQDGKVPRMIGMRRIFHGCIMPAHIMKPSIACTSR